MLCLEFSVLFCIRSETMLWLGQGLTICRILDCPVFTFDRFQVLWVINANQCWDSHIFFLTRICRNFNSRSSQVTHQLWAVCIGEPENHPKHILELEVMAYVHSTKIFWIFYIQIFIYTIEFNHSKPTKTVIVRQNFTKGCLTNI